MGFEDAVGGALPLGGGQAHIQNGVKKWLNVSIADGVNYERFAWYITDIY